MDQKSHYPDSARRWLTTSLGHALLEREGRVVEEAFDGIFGEECLQLGAWGDSKQFLRHTRTQRCALIDTGPANGDPSAIGQLHRLPVADSSIDVVLLPHTLDFSDRPHEILREVDRVLTAHGHIVILGFKPGGLWGIRRLVPGAGLPPDADHLVSDRLLKDWLRLLDFRIQANDRHFFRLPLTGLRAGRNPRWERRGRRWWPEFAACYMLTAQKRVSAMTPVRPLWRTKPKVVAGLAEPSTRVSKIRFDPNR